MCSHLIFNKRQSSFYPYALVPHLHPWSLSNLMSSFFPPGSLWSNHTAFTLLLELAKHDSSLHLCTRSSPYGNVLLANIFMTFSLTSFRVWHKCHFSVRSSPAFLFEIWTRLTSNTLTLLFLCYYHSFTRYFTYVVYALLLHRNIRSMRAEIFAYMTQYSMLTADTCLNHKCCVNIFWINKKCRVVIQNFFLCVIFNHWV